MPAATTDVRQWAREQGENIGARGRIPPDVQARYDDAHRPGVIPGEVIDDPSMGVTEADFPPEDDYDESAAAPEAAHKSPARERRPRTVKPPPAKGGIRERIFGTGKPRAPKGRTATRTRISLSNFAEETWSDLAFLAAPIPPLARILDIQAPYAGVVFDDQVRGTVVDTLLQPVARYSGMLRGLNGLVGPPVYVGMICMTGAQVQAVDQDGKLLFNGGEPVMVYDRRTQMLFQGLRYSLLQMTKITEVNADAIMARRQASEERMAAVEIMIATIFGTPAAPQFSPPPAPAPAPGAGSPNGFRYPDAPVMDETGADPGRMM
jgi:hypothetical protein